jgi:uroporphyrinogen decarboxylase
MDQHTGPVTKAPNLIRVLNGDVCDPPPIWLMRQAGRYLPEYRAVRERAGSFLDLCYAPALAAEVTLQPIKRFGFDAAILFSDILIVPHGLGQHLEFREGEGPVLEPIETSGDLSRLSLERVANRFETIYETVERVSGALDDDVALIGFCGAPWTVASYMIAGRGTSDQGPARRFAYRDEKGFQALIDIIVEASVNYLSGQVEAGAQVIQIFDSWAGNLPDDEFQKWSIAPCASIVSALKARYANVPVIGFPRAAGPGYVAFAEETGIDAVGCDTSLALNWIKSELQPSVAVQGNLDPLLLVEGGAAMERRVREILDELSDGRFIFNLGHGIVPATPPEHVAKLVEIVKGRLPVSAAAD